MMSLTGDLENCETREEKKRKLLQHLAAVMQHSSPLFLPQQFPLLNE